MSFRSSGPVRVLCCYSDTKYARALTRQNVAILPFGKAKG